MGAQLVESDQAGKRMILGQDHVSEYESRATWLDHTNKQFLDRPLGKGLLNFRPDSISDSG